MSIKKAVEEALMLKQKGKKLTSILRIVGKDLSAGDKIYTDACVLYNFQRYQDCIKKLFDLKIKFDFIDPQLFSFASNQTFTRQCKSSFAQKIIGYVNEYREYFSDDHIKIIKEGLSKYKEKDIPRHLLDNINHLFFQDIEDIKDSIQFSNLKNKIVINTYYDDSSSGIGDFLRGCCYLSTLLHENGVQFEIDLSRHTIGNHLKRTCHRVHGEIFDTEQYHKDCVLQKITLLI